MRSPAVEDRLRAAFEREMVALAAQGGALAAKVAIVMELGFAAVDWLIAPSPEIFWRIQVYRVVTAALLLGGVFAWRHLGARVGYSLPFFIGVALGTMINLIIFHLGGYKAAYYAGHMLIFVGLGLLVPFRPRHCLVTFGIIYLSYAVPILLYDNIAEPSVFITNNTFLVATIILACIAAHYEHKRRFAEFRAREELAEAHRALVETDRSKSEFFANVSHEIRTPLTLNILPVATLLEGGPGPLTQPQRDLLEAVDRNAQRLRALVGDLLDFAKLEAGRTTLEAERLELAPFLAEVTEAFEPALKSKGLALRRTLPAGPVSILGDRRKLEKILANLLGNAYKFTDRGEVAVELSTKNGGAVIEVRDTGPGIPADALPRLFERFHQVDGSASRRYGGTGIGLSFARELARLHGGDIACKSEVGRGSTFTVTLPLAREGAPAPPAPTATADASEAPSPVRETIELIGGEVAEREAAARGGDESGTYGQRETRILVGEDSADLGAYLVKLLEPDHAVRWVRDGQAALKAVREWRPDLVLTDVMMPRLDGLAVCAAIKEDRELRATPVILLSARGLKRHVVGGLEAGADDYLVKPFDPDILHSKIHALLRIRKLERELVAAGRLAAIAELILTLKHEINNPLTGIVGFVDVLCEQSSSLSEDDRRMLIRVKEAAFRISEVLTRVEELREARTTRYLGDHRMIDLGEASAERR